MTTGQQHNQQEHLMACQTAVDRAREGDDVRQLCLALIDLGSALFQARMFEQGVAALDEAEQQAATLDDPQFGAHCLALKAAAFQEIGRFHNAYEVIARVVDLAEARDDLGMKCDAFITQGQILANSGDPIAALERLKAAHALTNQLDDKQHLMKVLGTLGNVKAAMAALDDAQRFFEMAAAWAAQLGDKRAECGYLLNLGTIVTWQKNVSQAPRIFERALALSQELDDRDAELAALRYMIDSLHKLGQPEQVLPLAQRGIALSLETANHAIIRSFFEALALAHYQLGQPDEALRTIQEAVEHARSINDPDFEMNMLLQLGESCVAMALYEQALQAYQYAFQKIQHFERKSDEAHLVGRIGVVLAELGRVEEAIPYHECALEMARQHALPELEAEQLVMLALAYRDQHDWERARLCCENAVSLFSTIALEAEADKARQLLADISQA